jgi:hypothetical protein
MLAARSAGPSYGSSDPSNRTGAHRVKAGVVAGCFPQLYGALGESPPDQVITL